MINDKQSLKTERSRTKWLIPALGSVVVLCAIIWVHHLVTREPDGLKTSSTTSGTPIDARVAPEVPDEWEGPQGRWHSTDWRERSFEEQRGLTEEQQVEIERLRSIGYLSGSQPAPIQSGVTVYDRNLAVDGFNFYTTGDMPGAVLMDMQGHVLHRWEHGYTDAWLASPDRPELRPSPKGTGYWRRARLFENGDVMAIFEGLAILKVDKDSRLLWVRFGGFHHDLDVQNDGTIYVLTREAHIVSRYNPNEPILEDFIAVLDSGGNETSRVSILDALANSEYAPLLGRAEQSGDIFHTNTIEVLDGRIADELPGFRAGNVLVTMRELDLIAVVDMDAARVVWALSSSWDAPHQATLLEDGDIMVFDNRGNEGASRVIRFDPVTRDIVWIFKGERPVDFHSQECGSNHSLENGNTLIVESDRGKAFEVTPDGAIVWKYINPAQAGEELEYIATLFDLERLPPSFPIDWARSEGASDH